MAKEAEEEFGEQRLKEEALHGPGPAEARFEASIAGEGDHLLGLQPRSLACAVREDRLQREFGALKSD